MTNQQTHKSDEAIIKEIAGQVEQEYKMGGLSDGLYFEFAKDVALRFGGKARQQERERIHNEMYDTLPTGNVNALDWVLWVQKTMENLTNPNTTV